MYCIYVRVLAGFIFLKEMNLRYVLVIPGITQLH